MKRLTVTKWCDEDDNTPAKGELVRELREDVVGEPFDGIRDAATMAARCADFAFAFAFAAASASAFAAASAAAFAFASAAAVANSRCTSSAGSDALTTEISPRMSV